MNLLKKNDGFAFLYALMIILVLGVVSVPLVSLISSSNRSTVKSANESQATYMAESGMEAFIEYLREYRSGMTRVDYFNNYAGWVDSTVALPQGGSVRYQFLKPEIAVYGDYDIVSKAQMADYVKEVKYTLHIDKWNFTKNDPVLSQLIQYQQAVSKPTKEEIENYFWNHILYLWDLLQQKKLTWNELLEFINDFNAFKNSNGTTSRTMVTSGQLPKFEQYISDLREALMPFDYGDKGKITTVTELVKQMNSAKSTADTKQISFKCTCQPINLAGPNWNYDFTPNNTRTFVVYFTNGIMDTGGSSSGLWRMKGMVFINGSLTVNKPVFEVNNLVVTDTFSTKPGVKQTALIAAKNYALSDPRYDPIDPKKSTNVQISSGATYYFGDKNFAPKRIR